MSTAAQSIEAGVKQILKNHPNAGRDALIPILQEIQEQQGFLSREAVVTVGKELGLPASKIYGVATFYNQFRFTPQGRFHIRRDRLTFDEPGPVVPVNLYGD